MTIEFKDIFEFINKNILWFMIPIDVIIISLLTLVGIKYYIERRERKKHERRSKTNLSRNAKRKNKV